MRFVQYLLQLILLSLVDNDDLNSEEAFYYETASFEVFENLSRKFTALEFTPPIHATVCWYFEAFVLATILQCFIVFIVSMV